MYSVEKSYKKNLLFSKNCVIYTQFIFACVVLNIVEKYYPPLTFLAD